MLKFKILPDGKIVYAASFTDFFRKYREGSFTPEDSEETFLKKSAERAANIGLHIRNSDPESFVEDLIRAKIIALVTEEGEQ